MSTQNPSKKVVYAALGGNFAIAIAKFAAALWTGSSAMLSEGVHSLVDTGNQFLLLYGLHRAQRPPDRTHPLGHGRELYFWAFIVALLIFSLGAGVSVYEGVLHVLHPETVEQPLVSYIVLAVSFLFEGASWLVALREMRAVKGQRSYLRAVLDSKDPTTFTV
ncbi:cation diffusion facilitator family transporter, partial [Thioclava sp. BHET1]